MSMPDKHLRKSLWLVLLNVVLVTMACIIPSLNTKRDSGVNPTAVFISSKNAILPDPSAGLDGLEGYSIVFTQSADGNLDGKPYQSSTLMEYKRSVSKDEDLVRVINVTGSREYYMRSTRIGGALYTQSAKDAPCQGGVLDPQAEPLMIPSSRLVAIISADMAGSETVNGVTTDHYLFTQAGMPILETEMPVAGEVWIANPGGYVVKYILTSPAPTNPVGKGLEVGWNWNYELSQVNAIDQISPPTGCRLVPMDIPAMDDAVEISRTPGLIVYTTSSDKAKVIDFYDQRLPSTGWKKDKGGMPDDKEDLTLLYYEKESQVLVIILDKSSGNLEVSASLADRDANTTEEPDLTPQADEPPGAAAPTVDPAQSGLPNDIPLYIGATNMFSTGTLFKFEVQDASDIVAKFYDEQMPINGWKLMTEINSSPGSFVQAWTKASRITSITITTSEATTYVTLMVTNQ
jgi:hypothetical protein